jgi:hypothetical protein
MQETNITIKDDWNNMAYCDVVDCKPPQHDNEEYMVSYHFWRPLQKFPEDFYGEE